LNQSGPLGGVQFGYNWQFAPLWVVGLEADIQGAAITSDRAGSTGTATQSFAGNSAFIKTNTGANSKEALEALFTNPAVTASGSDSLTANLNWLGTVRGRLGFLVTPNLLLYATGGLAYGGVTADDSLTTNFNLTADSFALAYGQTIGGTTQAISLAATAGPAPSASASTSSSNSTNSISSSINVAQTTPPSGSISVASTPLAAAL
jgi:opacity protein-like surface antigen